MGASLWGYDLPGLEPCFWRQARVAQTKLAEGDETK